MLLSLYIKDFGIIEKTDINLGPGLNVLSGETGSGKSIIIEAIQVVTGGRAVSEYVRAGCEKAVVQAAADFPEAPEITLLLSNVGIDPDPEGVLILTREINRTGRNLCRINGQMVTLSLYREIGRVLVDIQGQNDQQMLCDPERQLYLLDEYGGEELSQARLQVSLLHRSCRTAAGALEGHRKMHGQWARKQELVNYQINEIDSASPKPGEDDELLAESKKLAGAEKIASLAADCYRDLYGGASTASALELTGSSLKALERLSCLDSGLTGVRDTVASALYQIEEACRDLSTYMDGLEFYPARLEFVEERLDIITALKKKYGPSMEDILRHRQEIEAERQEMEGWDHKAELLEKDLASLSKQLEKCAAKLTEMRKQAALAMEREIAREIQDLEMSGAVFRTVFSELEKTGEKGRERAEFYISTNPGEPARPLSRIASGGETSRLMLAVKIILAEVEGIPTLVFDEIDTGIGGRTIKSVATKLYRLSGKMQVICVTHSAAVASMAVEHLLISKRESAGRTLAEVISLGGEERIEELARMLGGGNRDGAAYQHARQLVEEAGKLKEN